MFGFVTLFRRMHCKPVHNIVVQVIVGVVVNCFWP